MWGVQNEHWGHLLVRMNQQELTGKHSCVDSALINTICCDSVHNIWNTAGAAIPATGWDMKYQVRLVEEGEVGFKELVILLPVLLFSLQMQLGHKTALVILIKVLTIMVCQEQKFGSCFVSFPCRLKLLKAKKEHNQVYNFFHYSKAKHFYNSAHSALYLYNSLIGVWISEKRQSISQIFQQMT